jgi:foldase protein PrsA
MAGMWLLLGAGAGVARADEPVATIAAPGWSATVGAVQVEAWVGAQRTPERALRFLVRARWTEGEARERGIVVSRAHTRAAIAADVGGPREVRRHLRKTKLTSAQLRYRYWIDLLLEEIRTQVRQPAALSVTPEQIDAYVAANPRTEPERRAVRIIVTPTRHRAAAARKALARGLTWRTAGRRYARATGRAGGARASYEPGELGDGRLERAVFAAAKNRLVGPVKTADGYAVFKVVRITPERPTPLDVQRATAEEVLASEAQERALAAFEADFTAKWRQRTSCAPGHAIVSVCA